MDNELELELMFPVKNRARSLRRHNSVRKALRKRNIQRNKNDGEWYNNLHQYSKNKIHCSCWMCSFHGEAASYIKADERFAYDMKEYQAV